MSPWNFPRRTGRRARGRLPVIVALLFGVVSSPLLAQESTPPANPQAAAGAATDTAAKKSPQELESLVAPIALYADDLLAQTLVASTYPLEIIQLQQWLAKHKALKGEALTDSVSKQSWDPSIKSMAIVPEVVERLANDIEWTTDLGNAFLAQQPEVMDAVQRMRKKAMDTGALATNEQQKVETTVVEQKTIIVVQPTNPEVIYVPVYSPVVVYGPPPPYPYPPIYYPPPPPPGAAFVAFSMGVMWASAAHGGSCCGCGWGGNDVYINVNNNYNQINNVHGGGGAGNSWQHNPDHRGGAPYSDKATANKYGGSSAKGPSAGTSNRSGSSTAAGVNQTSKSGSGKSSTGASASTSQASKAGSSTGASASKQGGGTPSSGGDKIGSQSISPSSGSKSGGGLSGGSQSKSSAQASRSRGASSMGSRGGSGRSGSRR